MIKQNIALTEDEWELVTKGLTLGDVFIDEWRKDIDLILEEIATQQIEGPTMSEETTKKLFVIVEYVLFSSNEPKVIIFDENATEELLDYMTDLTNRVKSISHLTFFTKMIPVITKSNNYKIVATDEDDDEMPF